MLFQGMPDKRNISLNQMIMFSSIRLETLKIKLVYFLSCNETSLFLGGGVSYDFAHIVYVVLTHYKQATLTSNVKAETGLIFICSEFKLNETCGFDLSADHNATAAIPHLLLCQTSVPYPSISGRPDDSTTWKRDTVRWSRKYPAISLHSASALISQMLIWQLWSRSWSPNRCQAKCKSQFELHLKEDPLLYFIFIHID